MRPNPLLMLCRPKQWIKNGFVMGPLLFSGTFQEIIPVVQSLIAAILFCLAASATYIVNDMKDRELDRRHPIKAKSRPLASGAVSMSQAAFLLAVLYGAILVGGLFLPKVLGVVVVYLVMNLIYTFWLKQVAVVDIFIVSFGFVLRVYAGIVAIEVATSYWMLITTLCLALYLASIKRRQELVLAGNESRDVLKTYTLGLVDRYAEMSATGALVFYSLFVLTVRPELAITVPFVLFGLFRYWYVVEITQGGESPTDILWEDWPLIGCIVAWIVIVTAVFAGLEL